MNKIAISVILTTALSLSAACLGDNPGEVYFNAYSKDGSGNYTVQSIYRTRDYGQTAALLETNFDASIYKDKAPGVFYKIPLGSQALYISKDTCRTWQWQSVLVGGGESFRSGAFSGECSDGRRFSTDYGKTWIAYSWNGVTGGIYSWCLGLEQGEIYAYPYNQKLYRSSDYGDNYVLVNDTINFGQGGVWPGWQIGELFIGRASDYKVFRSIDSGQSYSYLYQIPDYFNTIYWMPGLLTNEIICYSIRIYPSMVYNVMDIRFYHTYDYYTTIDSCITNHNVGIEDNGLKIIDNEQLTNYPNPFNNTTVVYYQLKKDDEINLAAYNAKGELVRKFFDEQQKAGNHQVVFDAAGLNSGMYYIRLQSKKTIHTIKCLYLK